MHKVRLYTYPPHRVFWPYIIINGNKPKFHVIRKYRSKIKSVIIDSGVEMFRNPNIKEYPGGPEKWVRHLIRLYIKVREYGVREAYIIIPDYPDDYVDSWGREHNLWINGKTNVDRTIENIQYVVKHYGKYPWIVPIQGYYMCPSSIGETIERLWSLGILDEYNYVAIANLCTTRNIQITEKTVRTAHMKLRNHKIHVFGPSIIAVSRIYRYIHSFDSVAFSRPVGSLRKRGYRWSCKNERERELYFRAWIDTVMNKYRIPIQL